MALLVFSNKCGQLGNRLFAFAHLISAAEVNKITVINLSFDEYARYFIGTNRNLFCQYPSPKTKIKSNRLRSILFLINKALVKCLRILRFRKSFFHQLVEADLPDYAFNRTDFFDMSSEHFTQITKRMKICFLFGRFFRDYRNIESHEALIRSYFTPIEEIGKDIDQIYSSLRIETDILIGVHIRRGDYLQFVDGKYFYSNEDYFKKMQEVSHTFTDRKVRFLVCSNESIDVNSFPGLLISLGPGHLVKDMYLLAKCDYIMGPPSTYTLWASFYGMKPLYQIRDIHTRITLDHFVMLPPEILFNFSFN